MLQTRLTFYPQRLTLWLRGHRNFVTPAWPSAARVTPYLVKRRSRSYRVEEATGRAWSLLRSTTQRHECRNYETLIVMLQRPC
ncbi:MAG: hypothetical protein M3Z24_10025, partial [Chloroflexota bacterium]|nr:hypothetical protein [Chloroflexota bacterium]